MKIKDILNMSNQEFNRLTLKELEPIVRKMQSVANARIKKVEKAGVFSPAVEGQKQFTMPDKYNLNMLRAKYRESANFLNNKTSTLQGAKEFNKMVQGNINSLREGKKQLNYADLSDYQKGKLWKLYTAIREIDPVLFNSLDSDQRIALASKFFRKNRSFETLRQTMMEQLDERWEMNDVAPELANAKGLLFT